MELTADEIRLIEDYRRQNAEQKANQRAMLHLLKTTADYLEWLQKNSRGSSFSTFMNEYEYQGIFCGWSPNVFYKRIIDLIQVADQWVSGV